MSFIHIPFGERSPMPLIKKTIGMSFVMVTRGWIDFRSS